MPSQTQQCYQLTLPNGWTPPKFQLGQKVFVHHKYEPLDPQDFGIITGLNNNSLITYPGRDGRLPGWDYTVTLDNHSPMWATYGGSGIFSEDELMASK
jgi:hypothetical protein